MAFTYDIKSDLRYKQGSEEMQIEAIREMLKDNLSMEKIAQYCKVSVDFVRNIAEGLTNKPK